MYDGANSVRNPLCRWCLFSPRGSYTSAEVKMVDDIRWKSIRIQTDHGRHPGCEWPMGHSGLGDGDDEQFSVHCECQRFWLMDAGRLLLRSVVPLQRRPINTRPVSELAQ